MKAAPLLVLALFATACGSVSPVTIRAGDVCFHCRRTITNAALAAEGISEQGHVFKFSSVTCMAEYLREHPNEPFKGTFVTDYARGKMLPAEDAWFVKFEVDPKLKVVDYAAFRAEESAKAFANEHGSNATRWEAALAAEAAHTGH